MSANAHVSAPSHGTDWLTTEELEHTLELVSRDPDAPLTERQQGVLRRAAVAGATAGLKAGEPRGLSAWGSSGVFRDALELGSDTHDGFVH